MFVEKQGYFLHSGFLLLSTVFSIFFQVLKVSGTDDDRIPPDGQESAALLKHNELNGNGSCPVVGCTVPIVPLNNVAVVSHNGTLISNDGTLISNNGTLISNNGTLKRSWELPETAHHDNITTTINNDELIMPPVRETIL